MNLFSKPESTSESLIVLRIYSPRSDGAPTWTGISISSTDITLQRVVELACRKQKISNPHEYALLLVLSTELPTGHDAGGKISATIVAPLNKTVATLPQALKGLALVPRNGAILLTPHRKLYLPADYEADVDERTYYLNDTADYAAVHKKYMVLECQRPKGLQRFLSDGKRKEWALIIDGDQLQILPSIERSVFGTIGTCKTAATPESHNLRGILMSRSPDDASAFTVEILQNNNDAPQCSSPKSSRQVYEFEAVNPKQVDELLLTVGTLQMLWGPDLRQSEKEVSSTQRCSSISTASTLVDNSEKDEWLAD
ncbi:hypothetical protein D9619_005751 [Psilocybe cf. subviscida]|uniref:Uncharacterized protein n=1 Tax=Psilocybe cf. subviscida TaxID=2480587 RepID=A0A8H5FBV2_9AGAR|nr:hypothetical protein D9619_005751 [Psilocybe cf. subviscida]